MSTDADFAAMIRGDYQKGAGPDKQLFSAMKVKDVNQDERRVTACISSEIIDRDDDIVRLSAMKAAMPAYMKNGGVEKCFGATAWQLF